MEKRKLLQQLYDLAELHDLNGLDFQHYELCKRRCWLHSKRCDFTDIEHIKMGLAINEVTYQRDKSIRGLQGLAPDRIDWSKCHVTELKKSASYLNAAKHQLRFYLAMLTFATGKEWSGSITVYGSTKSYKIDLTEGSLVDLLVTAQGISILKNSDKIPKKENLPICKECSNSEFCWGGQNNA